MVIKPFSHLARQSFTKTFVHGYAQSVVAASQSSYASTTTSLGQFHNYPVAKFAKASQLQGVFPGASSSSGAGARAGHAAHGSNANADGGLGLYYAAWQHAQQTGDDTELQQHQSARRIGWKSAVRTTEGPLHNRHRLDSSHAVDLLRPARTSRDRRYSENAVQDIKKAQDAEAEADALAKVDEAIAQEIQAIKNSNSPQVNSVDGQSSAPRPEALQTDSGASQASASPVGSGSIVSSADQSSQDVDTGFTSPALDESQALSAQIVELGQQQRHAEIPSAFESLLKEGFVPSVDAYNAILISAIQLTRNTYQAWPKALEVYSDMTRRGVAPNELSYAILIQFLTARGKEAADMQSSLGSRRARYGSPDGSFVFRSSELEQELFAGDNSAVFALKLYKKAVASFPKFNLHAQTYSSLIKTSASQSLVDDMAMIFSDMKDRQVPIDGTLYAPMIQAFGSVNDINAANKYYEDYRSLALSRPAEGLNHRQDMEVYAALIKAYFTCGYKDGGLRFYDRILQSYESAADGQNLKKAMEAKFIVDASVQHSIETGSIADALEEAKTQNMGEVTKDQVMIKLCTAAADANDATSAQMAYEMITSNAGDTDATMAMLAMSIRQGRLAEAKQFWNVIEPAQLSDSFLVDLTTMYAMALLRQGSIDEGLLQAQEMFGRIRRSAATQSRRSNAMEEIDEAIVLFGETLMKTHAVMSPQVSMVLIRTMIENGGLVSPVAEHAIASLGPECVFQLSFQDIALALHVQAGMLATPSEISDPAHAARFSHLLETVLNRGIPMDPSSVPVVTEALPKLDGTRPDLIQRWKQFLQPMTSAEPAATLYSPSVPATPMIETLTPNEAYDPYAYNTDYRASTIIAEKLESTTGRPESHLNDALARFKNVRRAGRHPRYNTYAKLITAAGKTKQVNTIHEIFGLAQTDIPFHAQYPAVKTGWIPILDSMVAACLTVGDRQQAAKFHQDLLDIGAAPSANTFGIYITTLEGTFDEATEAVKIFQRALSEGVEPGVFLYNAVIGKLGKARRIDDCLFYFGDMQSRNIRPSSVTYGTLVNALCRTSEERFAEEMFDEMESMPNYRPRAAPYNCIIQYFLNTKRDRSKVLAYFERMKSRNIKPTSHTYKLLIEAHASLEPINLGAAEAILDDIKTSGMQPEAVHYGSLIHAKGCVMQDLAGARALFDSVLSSGMIRATDTLYQNLFEAMVANHQVAETSNLLKDMASRNVAMTPYIANTLIHGWAAEGHIAEAKSIYDSLGKAKREPSTYEAMTRAFLSKEDRRSASAVVQEMLQKGYPSAVSEKVLVLVDGAAA